MGIYNFLTMKKTPSLLPSFPFSQRGQGRQARKGWELAGYAPAAKPEPAWQTSRSLCWVGMGHRSPSPALAVTLLTAGAVVASQAGAGSIHRVTQAAVLAPAFLGASIPIETAGTSYRRQAEIWSGPWLQRQQSHPTLAPREQPRARVSTAAQRTGAESVPSARSKGLKRFAPSQSSGAQAAIKKEKHIVWPFPSLLPLGEPPTAAGC